MSLFSEIPAYEHVKSKLTKSVDHNRVSHAQIFSCPDGAPGFLMALGYLQYIFCESQEKPCGTCQSCTQIAHHSHPDVHYSFPYVSTDSKKENCDNFMSNWRGFIESHSFFTTTQWNDHLETKNKQPQIYTAEGQRIIRALSLKSYSGKYKVLVLWQPELLNNVAANKLLKFIEEPDPNTIILMISHDIEKVLQTILSRCQVLTLGLISEQEMTTYLSSQNLDQTVNDALRIFSAGNLGQAMRYKTEMDQIKQNTQEFLNWLRACFKANPIEILTITEELSGLNRDLLKRLFIDFQQLIKRAFSYGIEEKHAVSLIDLSKISPFIDTHNIDGIYNAIEDAIRDITRNGNAKFIIYDLSLRMHYLLHAPRS